MSSDEIGWLLTSPTLPEGTCAAGRLLRTFYPLVDTVPPTGANVLQKTSTTVGQCTGKAISRSMASIRIFPRKQPWRSSCAAKTSPRCHFELAIWLNADDSEAVDQEGGWHDRAQKSSRAHQRYWQLHPPLAGRI
jgi:hypothetical protein